MYCLAGRAKIKRDCGLHGGSYHPQQLLLLDSLYCYQASKRLSDYSCGGCLPKTATFIQNGRFTYGQRSSRGCLTLILFWCC